MSSDPVKPSKKSSSTPARVKNKKVQPDGIRIPTLNDDLVLVRFGANNPSPAKLESRERASALVMKAGKALSKPGIRRETVFGYGSGRGISAYSVYPADPTKIIRESADGEKRIGRIVGGRFRPIVNKP